MARRPLRTALVIALLLAGAFSLLSRRGSSDRLDGGDPALLTDRVWLQDMPTSPTQHIHALLFLGDAPFGVFQHASAYQSKMEVFEHEREGGEVRMRFPQANQRKSLTFRAGACSDHPPFDLCLVLSDNPWGGPKRYFGFRDEQAAGAKVTALRHRLGHAAVDGP